MAEIGEPVKEEPLVVPPPLTKPLREEPSLPSVPEREPEKVPA